MEKLVEDELSILVTDNVIQSFSISEIKENWQACLQQTTKLIAQGNGRKINLRGDLPFKLEDQILSSIQQANIHFTIYGHQFQSISENQSGLIITE